LFISFVLFLLYLSTIFLSSFFFFLHPDTNTNTNKSGNNEPTLRIMRNFRIYVLQLINSMAIQKGAETEMD